MAAAASAASLCPSFSCAPRASWQQSGDVSLPVKAEDRRRFVSSSRSQVKIREGRAVFPLLLSRLEQIPAALPASGRFPPPLHASSHPPPRMEKQVARVGFDLTGGRDGGSQAAKIWANKHFQQTLFHSFLSFF